MTRLVRRNWVPQACEDHVQSLAGKAAGDDTATISRRLGQLAEENRRIHEKSCFNLNPATNIMNPKAEALLASGLGSRPSLGYPGDKYETGLEAIEEIEVIAAELCAEVFDADHAEVRVASGAMANLYAFMAICEPGDAVIVPPPAIGGHVTHNRAGCAGLYGLDIHEAPVDRDGYTVDLDGLERLAGQVKPKLMSIGGSLNLFPHPVAEIAAIARKHGARLLFDAAHQCGMIAGGEFANPLHQGADLMTMSTYKSLGGPAGGLIVTDDAELAQRLDVIAFPGMTANFDAGRVAALAMTMLDWREHGRAYARAMASLAKALAEALASEGLPLHAAARGWTASHQFAIEAARFGGGQNAARTLRDAGFLACGIGLPIDPVEGDMNGLRLGTPELCRIGVRIEDAPRLASLLRQALVDPDPGHLAGEVADWRASFDRLHFVCS
ncbi:MAG: aminotransferase class I/II-fold pyridoxal phosphate-dependent enzyme [Geminicoccaceae bacterium]